MSPAFFFLPPPLSFPRRWRIEKDISIKERRRKRYSSSMPLSFWKIFSLFRFKDFWTCLVISCYIDRWNKGYEIKGLWELCRNVIYKLQMSKELERYMIECRKRLTRKDFFTTKIHISPLQSRQFKFPIKPPLSNGRWVIFERHRPS